MAIILNFPEPRRPVLDERDGYFGLRLDEVCKAVVHYAVTLDDQGTAFNLLDKLVELEELSEYIALPIEMKPWITSVPGLEDV